MSKKMVSFRCKIELLEAFQAFCEANNTNLTEQLTEFMESAVKRAVHINNDNCTDSSNDTSTQALMQSIIETQMAEIEARLEKEAEYLKAELETLRDDVNTGVHTSNDKSDDRCKYLEDWLSNTLPKLKLSPGYRPNSASKLITSIQRLAK